MSNELTEHGRKALERCIREHQNFIRLADDYDLDEMSVQALQTAIESMQMRLDATPNPAPGPSEHDESWSEMMEHDYDTAVRGPVIKLIALLEDVAVQHEGLENYGDTCGPSMCIRACRGAIAALKAAHAQPVTPAGGEVEPDTVVHNADTPGHFAIITPALPAGTKLYLHPPVSDAALAEVIKAAGEIMVHASVIARTRQVSRLTRAIAALNQRGGGDHG